MIEFLVEIFSHLPTYKPGRHPVFGFHYWMAWLEVLCDFLLVLIMGGLGLMNGLLLIWNLNWSGFLALVLVLVLGFIFLVRIFYLLGQLLRAKRS